MNPAIRNILAVITGIFVGGAVNMGIIMISGSIIPLPEGVDNTTMEGLQESIHLFKPINFLMPFLAHALGTIVGALVAGYMAVTKKKAFAMAIGVFFLIGGISNVFLIPAPVWFNVVDLALAYVPMAWIAGKITS